MSYDDSLLAIVESDRSVPDQNEVTFSLKYWDKSLNIIPSCMEKRNKHVAVSHRGPRLYDVVLVGTWFSTPGERLVTV